MREQLVRTLRAAADEVGAAAAVVLRTGPGHQEVVAATVGGGDEAWPLFRDAAAEVREHTVRGAVEIGRLLPTAFRLAVEAPISHARITALEPSDLSLVLVWCTDPDAGASPALSDTTSQNLALLAPLVDAHEQASHAAATLTTVVGALEQAVVVIDGSGHAEVNPAAAALLRIPAGTHAGHSAADALRTLRLRCADPEGLEMRAFALISDPSATVRAWPWHLLDDDRHFEVASFPIASGGRNGRVWVFDDITEQVHLLHAEQRALTQLAEREQQYRLLAENASDVVFQGSTDAVIQWVSPSVREVLGFEPDELVGRSVRSLVAADDLPQVNKASNGVNSGTRMTYRARYRTANGELRWAEVVARPVFGADGRITARVGSLRDVHDEVIASMALEESERNARQLAAQFDLARHAAEQANLAKTTFLSRMSHELRTPLNAVTGFAQLLEMDDLTPSQRQSVQYILSGGRHLLGLINEVLDISRIEVGKLALSMEPVDLASACSEALDLVTTMAATSGITIAPLIAPPDPLLVRGDRQRVVQIVLNLLTNAVKYNRPGGTVTVTCAHRSGGEAVIGVRDTGRGVDAADLDRLFEPFDRLGAEATSIEGTGIGLTLSNALAGAMGGRIEVDSTPDVGSEFRLVLLTGASDQALARAVATASHEPATDAGPVRVLYIEDNPQAAELMQRIVQRRPNATLRVASRGADGVNAAAELLPDLVFLDLHLPDVRGDDVLARLRSHPATASTPVVIVTADASPGLQSRLSSAGADGFLTKPIDVAEVLRWIDRQR